MQIGMRCDTEKFETFFFCGPFFPQLAGDAQDCLLVWYEARARSCAVASGEPLAKPLSCSILPQSPHEGMHLR